MPVVMKRKMNATTLPVISFRKSRLPKYMERFGVESLGSMTSKQLREVFLVVCDDFFAQQISIYQFSAISEDLLYKALATGEDDLSGAILAAAELYYYKKHEQDSEKFFVFLKEVMEFYLQSR